MEGLSKKALKQGIFGNADVAKMLGVSVSTVKNLWEGRQYNGQTIAPQLNYHLTASGKKYSTLADINNYRAKAFGRHLERLHLQEPWQYRTNNTNR